MNQFKWMCTALAKATANRPREDDDREKQAGAIKGNERSRRRGFSG